MILAATLDIISHSLEPQFLVYLAHGPRVWEPSAKLQYLEVGP